VSGRFWNLTTDSVSGAHGACWETLANRRYEERLPEETAGAAGTEGTQGSRRSEVLPVTGSDHTFFIVAGALTVTTGAALLRRARVHGLQAKSLSMCTGGRAKTSTSTSPRFAGMTSTVSVRPRGGAMIARRPYIDPSSGAPRLAAI
jgi:LPXTG-motif cell wall-anchored protein